MTFKERGYVNEFGYGAFRHETRDEMLIIDTDVFGPCCSPEVSGGRHFSIMTPDGRKHACYNVWDALAAWLGHMLSYEIQADNQGIQSATEAFLKKYPEKEQMLLDITRFITTNYLNMKCAWGHKPAGDLIETGSAKLVIDLDGDIKDPYWGTVQRHDGSADGRNMFGLILEQIRDSARPGYTTTVPACHGCTMH